MQIPLAIRTHCKQCRGARFHCMLETLRPWRSSSVQVGDVGEVDEHKDVADDVLSRL